MKTLQYAATCLIFLVSGNTALAQSIVIDDFESGHRISCNTETGGNQFLFNHYDLAGATGVEEVTTEEARSGSYSLKETVTDNPDNSYMQFRPTPCDGQADYMWEQVLDTAPWQYDTYNRLKFWVKLPPGIGKAGIGNDNFHFGTYTRCTTCPTNSYESDGGHWYHHYNVESTGEWHQFIVDWHPNSKRGVSGATEHGQKEYPTSEAGYNYFDLLTRWYVQAFSSTAYDGFNTPVYLDDFEVYTETRPENVGQVYALNGVYVPGTNEIQVGWQRNKDEQETVHEVRYAFTDIHTLGFANATFAINAEALGWAGYNGMEWVDATVDVSGQSSIFVAIKPTESSLFRQIEIPVASLASGQCTWNGV